MDVDHGGDPPVYPLLVYLQRREDPLELILEGQNRQSVGVLCSPFHGAFAAARIFGRNGVTWELQGQDLDGISQHLAIERDQSPRNIQLLEHAFRYECCFGNSNLPFDLAQPGSDVLRDKEPLGTNEALENVKCDLSVRAARSR